MVHYGASSSLAGVGWKDLTFRKFKMGGNMRIVAIKLPRFLSAIVKIFIKK
jgi:hypothetical protein